MKGVIISCIMNREVFGVSAAAGKEAEAIWRGKAKPEKSSAIGKSAPIEIDKSIFPNQGIDTRSKINPQTANLNERVLSQGDVASQSFEFDLDLIQDTADTVRLIESEKNSSSRSEIVDTGADEESLDMTPQLREEPAWDGTLQDLHRRMTALHKVITRESKRFNQTPSQAEKGEIGKLLGLLYEDMDTWIHRFEMWKAEHDIQKAVQDRDQNKKSV